VAVPPSDAGKWIEDSDFDINAFLIEIKMETYLPSFIEVRVYMVVHKCV
jgi:hypothetical protein